MVRTMQRRIFIKRAFASLALAAGGSTIYAGGFERHHVETTVTPIHLGLDTPLRIAAIGDLHFDPLFEHWYIEDVVNCVRAAQPDILFLTGDYVSKVTDQIDVLATLLAAAAPPLGIYAVLGNHEFWSGEVPVIRAFEKNGIVILRNESVPLPGSSRWFIAGLESYWAGRPDPSFFDRSPAAAQYITIIHEPDPFQLLDHPRIRLQVSGHTHGGQIRMPFLGALRLPSWGRQFDAGHFTAANRHLYVNRGIGTVRVHFRFHCRPEISCLDVS